MCEGKVNKGKERCHDRVFSISIKTVKKEGAAVAAPGWC